MVAPSFCVFLNNVLTGRPNTIYGSRKKKYFLYTITSFDSPDQPSSGNFGYTKRKMKGEKSFCTVLILVINQHNAQILVL